MSLLQEMEQFGLADCEFNRQFFEKDLTHQHDLQYNIILDGRNNMANIIDQYGIINQQINELEIIKAKLKAELVARGVGSYNGESFFAEVQEYDRENISAPLVRKFGDADFVAQVTQIQHIKAVVVKPLEA